MSQTIELNPIGEISPELLAWLPERLAVLANQPVSVGPPLAAPAGAYDRRRGQYQGEALLNLLLETPLPDGARRVGLVDTDCYAPGLNFIFGQAIPGGQVALVALPRLRQEYYRLPPDPELFRTRVLKEIIHELGHTWGLPHCPDPHCVMHFSNSLPDTDRKGLEYCPTCAEAK